MGIFDKLFGRQAELAPAETKRVEPVLREPRRAVRRYKAARPDRISNFPMSLNGHGISDDVRGGLRGLVSNSRHQSQNVDYLKAFYAHLRRNVIGRKGLQIKPQARFNSGELDTGANQKIKTAFEDWSKPGNCTVCGRWSFADVLRITVSSSARDGNGMLRMYSGPDYGPYGFQLQILDFLQLDIDLFKELGDGFYIRHGIEFSPLDRPVAYHFFKAPPNRVGYRGERVRVPAAEIIHLFNPYDLSTTPVGVPWTHTALRRLHKLAEFEEAAVTNAQWGASKMGFFVKNADPDDEPPAQRKGENGTAGDGDQNEEPEIDEIEAGLLETLPEGWDFKGFDPAFPNGDIGPFNKSMLRGAAAGLSVSYTSLANDLEGYSYSGLRAGLGEERDEWTILQDWVSNHLCGRVADRWLDMALLTRKLDLPFSKRDKYAAISWTPRGWQSVNPKDDAVANSTDLMNLLKSPQEICAARGTTFEAVLDDFKEAAAMAGRRNIDLWQVLEMGASVSANTAKQPDAKED